MTEIELYHYKSLQTYKSRTYPIFPPNVRRHCLCTDDGGGPENENRAVFFGFTVDSGKTRTSKRQMLVSNLRGHLR